MGDPNLQFTTAPVLLPPEIQIDPDWISLAERQLGIANTIPLPEDENNFLD
jgi:GTP-binding nuclear protein Ran